MTEQAAKLHHRDAGLARREIGKLLADMVSLWHESEAERARLLDRPDDDPVHDLFWANEACSDTVAGLAGTIAADRPLRAHQVDPRFMQVLAEHDPYPLLARAADLPRFRRYVLTVDHLGRLVRDYLGGRRDAA